MAKLTVVAVFFVKLLMGIFNYFNKLFSQRFVGLSAGKAKHLNLYLISDSEKILALLSNATYDDMFWQLFSLTPLVEQQEDLDKLYSNAFWDGSEIKIREWGSAEQVSFILAMEGEGPVEEDEENIDFEYICHRPQRVKLRGPYTL